MKFKTKLVNGIKTTQIFKKNKTNYPGLLWFRVNYIQLLTLVHKSHAN